MVSLCGFVVSFWLVNWLGEPCDRIFLVVLGGFLGGYCASAIVEYYHLSGSLVGAVYPLCILLGAGIGSDIYEKRGTNVEIATNIGLVFGGVLGVICADMIVHHYHLSGFFVWVVYALCILLGVGICGPFYYFWSKWLAKWLPKKFLDSKNKYGINKYGSIAVMTIMAIIWEFVMTMGIVGVMLGWGLLRAQYLQWF